MLPVPKDISAEFEDSIKEGQSSVISVSLDWSIPRGSKIGFVSPA